MLNPYQGPCPRETTSSEFLHSTWSQRRSWSLARLSSIKDDISAGKDPTSLDFVGLCLEAFILSTFCIVSTFFLSLDRWSAREGALNLFESIPDSLLPFLPEEVCSNIHWMKNNSFIYSLTEWCSFKGSFACVIYSWESAVPFSVVSNSGYLPRQDTKIYGACDVPRIALFSNYDQP